MLLKQGLSYTARCAVSSHALGRGNLLSCKPRRSHSTAFSESFLLSEEASLRPEIVRINTEHPEAAQVAYVAEKIRSGSVVGMPTDTFYGLAADPFNLHAVDRIYEIKTRSRHKPLSLLIESVDQASDLAWPVPEIFFLLARRFWPGPLTIIVKADPKLPLKVTANTGNVALRVPSAEVPLAIVRAFGAPITATSANLHGASECTNAQEVRDQLGDCLPLIVDGGESPRDMPSTIVDLTGGDSTWRMLRRGAIPAEQIVELLGQE